MSPKSIDYYLSCGMDMKTAEYFAKGRRKIISVQANDDYTLTITFDNGELRLLDMNDDIKQGGTFAPLADIETFRRVYLDETQSICWDKDPNIDSSIEWNNVIDLCPDGSYIYSTPIAKTHE